MEKVNEEMSLVKIEDNIFTKIRRFWSKLFGKKNYGNTYEYDSDNQKENVKEQEEPKKKNKLFNYDDPQDYFQLDNETEMAGKEAQMENSINYTNIEDKGVSKYFEDEQNDGDESEKNENTANNYADDNYKGSNYEEKEELEQKLINYYTSIKSQMTHLNND